MIYSKDGNKQLSDCLFCNSSTLAESFVSGKLSKNALYPVYGAAGAIGNINDYQVSIDAILIIKDGAGVGRVQLAKGKYSVIGTLNYLTAKDEIDIKYIYYALMYFDFSKYMVGSGIPHIYFKDYGKAKIFCPPYLEQQKIATMLSDITDKINIEHQILDKLKEQKQYLLSSLFI